MRKMQRLIREEEPPRPSTRLSSLGDSATIVAGNRGLDVKRLVQFLAGDLDWVVMKALEKDRNRRYATPGNFAEDIERYLRHEAILARPPSTGYRLQEARPAESRRRADGGRGRSGSPRGHGVFHLAGGAGHARRNERTCRCGSRGKRKAGRPGRR